MSNSAIQKNGVLNICMLKERQFSAYKHMIQLVL